MENKENIIKVGNAYNVTVVKILTKGIIVQIEDMDKTEFIHISKISESYVSNINDFVSVGDKLTAIGVNSNDDKRIAENSCELSLHHLHLKPKAYRDEPYVKDMDSIENTLNVSTEKKEKTLDDMIAAANQCFKDKMKDMQSKNIRRNGRNRRKQF